MRVIVETVETSEIAGLALAIDGGSSKDPPGAAGLAHLTEHCIFEAKHGAASSVEHRLNQLAAEYNAFTSHDLVEYHAFVPKRAFDGLLTIVSEIAHEPLANVDQAAFDHEKQVVEAERGLRTEDAQGQVAAYSYAAIFPEEHPYSRPVIGTRQSVASLDLQKVQAFVAANYRPERMTLYVGAPRGLDAFQRIDQVFAASSGGALVETNGVARTTLLASSPVATPGPLVVHDAPLAAPELWISWPLRADTVKARAQAELLADVADALVRPTFTSHPSVARAGCELMEEALSLVLSCQLVLNDSHDVDGALNRTLADLRQGFSEAKTNHDWMWAEQRDVALESTFHLEGLQNRVVQGALLARSYGNPLLSQSVLDELSHLDMGEVSGLGYGLADRAHTFAVLMKPQSGVAAAVAQANGGKHSDDSSAEAPDSQQTLALVRPQLPREVTEFRLENGLTVIVQQRPGTRFVSAMLGFRGGTSWAKDPALGLAAALAETWRVESSPSQAGLSLRWYDGADDRHFVARSVAPDLNAALEALKLERNPHLEWPSLRFRRMLPALTSAENSFDQVADRKRRLALFGAHPYSAYAPAANADVISAQALGRFFDSIRRPDNSVLVLVLDGEPAQIKARVEAHFGSWRNPKGPAIAPPPAIDLQLVHPRSELIVVHKPSSQVELSFDCLLEHGTGKERVAEEALAEALRKRAEGQLRGQTGIAYFAAANLSSLAAGVDRISLTTSVDNRHSGQALSFFESLRDLRTPPISDAGLAWLRFQTLQQGAFDDQTTLDSASSLYRAWLGHRAMSELDQDPTLVAGITTADLEAPLLTCTQHAVLVAIGDQATIERAVNH